MSDSDSDNGDYNIGLRDFMFRKRREVQQNPGFFLVTPGMAACHNIECDRNAKFIAVSCISPDCDCAKSLRCECNTVYYCSENCKRADIGHKCHLDNDSLSMVTQSYCAKCREVSMIIYTQTERLVIKGIFVGVKKGKKFIRGIIGYGDDLRKAYSGDLKTFRSSDGILCVMPHGKGCWTMPDNNVFTGEFVMGKTKRGHVTNWFGVESKMVFDEDVNISGFVESKVSSEGYMDSFIIESRHEVVSIVPKCTARKMNDSWKNTLDATCLRFDANGGEGYPIIISKKDLGEFENSMFILLEHIENIFFKTHIHWNGSSTFDINSEFTLSLSSCGICPKHGSWNFASICEKFDREDIDDMSKEPLEEATDKNCSCSNKDTTVTVGETETEKSVPVKIPKIKGDGKKWNNKNKNSKKASSMAIAKYPNLPSISSGSRCCMRRAGNTVGRASPSKPPASHKLQASCKKRR